MKKIILSMALALSSLVSYAQVYIYNTRLVGVVNLESDETESSDNIEVITFTFDLNNNQIKVDDIYLFISKIEHSVNDEGQDIATFTCTNTAGGDIIVKVNDDTDRIGVLIVANHVAAIYDVISNRNVDDLLSDN